MKFHCRRRRGPLGATTSILLLAALGGSASASPDLPKGVLSGQATNPAPLLPSTDPRAMRFMPVGQLLTGDGTYHCTASVIAGADAPAANRRALLLTAGHCVEETDDQTVIVDRNGDPAWSFTPAYFIDTRHRHVSFGIRRVLYATMKTIDLAVLETNATYGELAAMGVHPLRLATGEPLPGAPIELVHVPVNGVPEEERFLRHSSCHAGRRVPLVEGDHPWWWEAAMPNDCQGVAGGTSGSPVFAQDGNAVLAVLNTTATPGYFGCGYGRPCELGPDSIPAAREDTSYAIPVDRIAHALRADGSLDLGRLDDGRGARVSRTDGAWISQRTEVVEGERVPARWNLRIDHGAELVRYKVGPARTTDCADLAGYGPPEPASAQPLLHLGLAPVEGIQVACVIGGNTGGVWQPPAHASARLRQIDETPPALRPPLDTRDGDGAIEVKPAFLLWELGDLYVKHGPATATDCRDTGDYARHIRTRWYRVGAKAPWRFCTYGTDAAGNPGPQATFDFN